MHQRSLVLAEPVELYSIEELIISRNVWMEAALSARSLHLEAAYARSFLYPLLQTQA